MIYRIIKSIILIYYILLTACVNMPTPEVGIYKELSQELTQLKELVIPYKHINNSWPITEYIINEHEKNNLVANNSTKLCEFKDVRISSTSYEANITFLSSKYNDGNCSFMFAVIFERSNINIDCIVFSANQIEPFSHLKMLRSTVCASEN